MHLLGNLVRNAIERGGVDVTVTIGELDNDFDAQDDGPDIPSEKQSEEFDADYSTTKGGLGRAEYRQANG